MSTPSAPTDKQFVKNAIDATIKISLLAIMVVISYKIIQPFIMPVAWAVIIAVALGPFVEKMIKVMGGRRKLTITLFTCLAVGLLVVPTYFLAAETFHVVQEVAQDLKNNELDIPPAPEKLADVPLVGQKLTHVWNTASKDLKQAIQDTAPLAANTSKFLLGSIGDGLGSVLQFVIAFIIAAFFMLNPAKGFAASSKVITSVAGERGEDFTKLATATIRGVMNGVVGVALIQAILATIGMVIMGIPAAGLWGLLVMVCAIAQLPPIIILGPIAAWAFSAYDTTPAVIFLIWALLVSGCDGIIKPVLMARGLDTPMLVILLGAIGGMMLSGIIGLFVGAVVFSITYTLFMAWVEEKVDEVEASSDDEEAQEPA
ncbi:AI-2E family transporter [Verrucomicrobiaceae bacterium N1E253]|uniref:AI-2E family transporter n=1 Tax=Oceaniferula marina TaxID=2748318 RepID=A0A851GEI8_9BACT|nr:AI-2E family transporter [Oceaniferula marina]NWK55836.1 AI-2E family transporter [Oceaniferula marina]